MVFKRVLHDGLFTVVHREGFNKITFINKQYETNDFEECSTLIDMGYDYEGEMPEEPENKIEVEDNTEESTKETTVEEPKKEKKQSKKEKYPHLNRSKQAK